MTRFFSLLFILLLALTASAKDASQVLTDSVASPSLGVNRAYTVYLPAGYDPARHYPVLYLLHGKGGGNVDWTVTGHLREVADRLVASGELQPTVIIMPDAGERKTPGRFGYFNFKDWPFEDFFFTEFIPAVESRYNAGGSKGQRAVAGLSMGGGGATAYAQHHPDMFGSVYAMSALMDIPEGRKFNSENDIYNAGVHNNSCIAFVKNADDVTREALRTVVWYIDCGDDDFLLDRNLEFYKAMRTQGIPAQLRVRDGAHDWEYWHTALYTALPFISRNFKK